MKPVALALLAVGLAGCAPRLKPLTGELTPVAMPRTEMPRGYHQIFFDWEYSDQDMTGTLGLVDRETGDSRSISRSVDWFEIYHPDGRVGSTRAVYLVRGRTPSPRDGIWAIDLGDEDLR